MDFFSKALRLDDKVVSLQLWDTAGQERFQSVTKSYYRGAQGVLLMYDISQEESFIAVKSWINSINVSCKESAAVCCGTAGLPVVYREINSPFLETELYPRYRVKHLPEVANR